MLVVQLRHAAWRRPLCRMEQKVPSFLQYASCLLGYSGRTGRDVTDKEIHFVMQRDR